MQGLLRDKGVRWIGLGWTAFLAENLVLSHNRDVIIGEMGDQNYHSLYNTLSTCACASILYGYIRHGRGKGPLVWNVNRPLMRTSALALQSLGLIGFSQFLPKLQVPVSFGTTSASGHAQKTGPTGGVGQAPGAERVPGVQVYGMKRVTRHPTFWALGFLGLGSALATPFAPEVVMFSAPAVFALIGGSHQDYRYRRGSGGQLTEEIDRISSGIPFLALASGRQSWSALYSETKMLNALIAILLAFSLHRRRVRIANITK